jgi:serine-type D-Ala-D-Ala carboxypeptidase (penicillin-binding protein 5/6)
MGVTQAVDLFGRRMIQRFAVVLGTAAVVAAVSAAPASASTRARHRGHVAHTALRSRGGPLYKGAILEDADSGKVLYEYNPEMGWPPASMAKMMLLLVAEEQIKAGRVSPGDSVHISERSAHTGGSRLGLRQGDVYPLGELIKAALIKSANDAAVAVAEKIAGSVEAAVRMMNLRAHELGMLHTEYYTVDGLPPRPTHDLDRTTATDLATVARAIIRETNLLEWSGLEEAPFDGGVCMLHNTNHLVGHFYGCDGLKTGFTSEAGFNLTATARRGDMRLIAVVLGTPSNQQRFAQAAKLMDWGFDHYTAVSLLKSGEPLPVHVQVESGPLIQPVAANELKVVLPKDEVGDLKLEFKVPPAVSAPLHRGDTVGEVLVQNHGVVVSECAAVCPIAVQAPAEQYGGNVAYGEAPPPVQGGPIQENQ